MELLLGGRELAGLVVIIARSECMNGVGVWKLWREKCCEVVQADVPLHYEDGTTGYIR